jgi:predicted RNase H-like nuclease (RuvC/YqgF family)
MRRFTVSLVTVLLCACATPEERAADTLLGRADARLAAEDYSGAIASYNEFMNSAPKHPQAARVRATEKALEKLLAAQAGLGRAQQAAETSRRELNERLAETERLKAETERVKNEIAKLRADLERLRSIDLQAVRPKPQ